MFGWLFNWCRPNTPVNTVEEALAIGQVKIQQKFPGDYNIYVPTVTFDSSRNAWHLRYYLKDVNEYTLGGCGPGAYIDKFNGKITYLKGEK